MFSDSNLNTLGVKLRYVPIIMPDDLRQRYPARSKLRLKERVYVCAPQLNFEVFVNGTFEDRLREYVRGIATSAPHLAGLGATPAQLEEFDRIMATVVDRVLAELR
jgi:hypothetical protein